MLKEFRKLFIVLIAFSFSFQGNSQEGTKVLMRPFKYMKPHEGGDPESNITTGRPWIVYSIMDNNPTYKNAGGQDVNMTANFMDMFYVVDKKGDYLHVFKDDIHAASFSKLTAGAVDWGWIRDNQVLLWDCCLRNQQDITKKAMLLNTIEYATEGTVEKGLGGKVRFYKDPELKILADYTCDIFDIFYIYKYYNDPATGKRKSALLGSNYRMEASFSSPASTIKGWVDLRRVTQWDHRVSVYPNTEEKAIKERQSTQVRAMVFPYESSAIKYRDRQTLDQSDIRIINIDSLKKQNQISGYFRRFPVLSNQKQINTNNGIIQIGAIGQVESMSGTGKCDQECWAEINRIVNENRAKARNINILFVIDGTLSMKPYFNKVSEAVIESMNTLAQPGALNKFRFACAIYRDKADGNDVFEFKQLTPTYTEISSWLKSRVAKSDPKDKDAAESLFNGLINGLRSVNLPEDQTNYVILIGDAGNRMNDPAEPKITEVINLLSKYNANFITFQVNNPGTPDYINFVTQTKTILNEVATAYYNRNSKLAKSIEYKIEPLTWENNGKYDQDRKYKLKNSPIMGFIMVSNIKGTIPEEVLKGQVIQEINSINDTTNQILEAVQRIMEGGGLSNLSKAASGGLLTYLSRLNIPVDNLRVMANEHFQLYYPGFSTIKVEQLTLPLWQFELFLSRDELYEITRTIEGLYTAGSAPDRRNAFYEAWLDLIKAHIGSSKTNNEIQNMKFEEIELLVFGAVGTTPLLQHRLKDIKDESLISDNDLNGWLVQMEMKKKKIDNIANLSANTKETFSFQSNDLLYFWIPQSYLP